MGAGGDGLKIKSVIFNKSLPDEEKTFHISGRLRLTSCTLNKALAFFFGTVFHLFLV